MIAASPRTPLESKESSISIKMSTSPGSDFAVTNEPNTMNLDSAEKPYECFDKAQHERKISNDFARSSVRPEALEG